MESDKRIIEIISKIANDNNLTDELDKNADFERSKVFLTAIKNRDLMVEGKDDFTLRELLFLREVIFNMGLDIIDNARVTNIEDVTKEFKSKKEINELTEKDFDNISYKKLCLSLMFFMNPFDEMKNEVDSINEAFPKDSVSSVKQKILSRMKDLYSDDEKRELEGIFVGKDEKEYGFFVTNFYKEYKKREVGRNVKLNKDSLTLMSDQIYAPYDLVAMTDSKDVGIKMARLYRNLEIEDEKKASTKKLVDNEYLYAMNPKKFYQVSLYRVSQEIGKIKNIGELYDLVNSCIDTKKELDKINKDEKRDIPVTIVDSIDEKGNAEYIELNNEVIEKVYDEMMQKMYDLCLLNTDNQYDIIRKNKDNIKLNRDAADLNTDDMKLGKETIKNVINKIDNPEDFLYLAYKKRGFITAADMGEICNEEGLMITPIITKMIADIKYKAENDKEYLKSDDFARFIKGTLDKNNVGYMPNLLKQLYENGNIDGDTINVLKEYAEKYEIEEYCNLEMMNSNTKDLVYLYKKLNKDKIVDILKKKEKFTDEEIKEFISKDDAFEGELTREKRIELQALYKYQKDMFVAKKGYKNPEELDILFNELGELSLSSAVVIDLFKEGIVDEEAAKTLDDNFDKFYNAYTVKKFKREGFKDYKEYERLLNAYAHGKYTIRDIVKGYVNGDIPEDFYRKIMPELQEQILKDYKPDLIFDKKDAKELYTNATKKDAHHSEMKKLKRYYDEYGKLLDEKQNAELVDELTQKEINEINEGRISKKILVRLGENGLLANDVLSTIVDKKMYDVIENLMQKNAIGFDKAKCLFEDQYSKDNQQYTRRELLEKIFRQSSLSNEEKMNILCETYAIDDLMSEEQKNLNNENFVYFLEKGLVKSIENYEYEREEKLFTKTQINGGYAKPDQEKFPLLKRMGAIKSVDKDIAVDTKNNGFIFKSDKYGKVIIETFGKKGKKGKIENDTTDHRTYIMDLDDYEKLKGRLLDSNMDGREIIFGEVINVIREKIVSNGSWINHRDEKGWANRLKEKVIGIKPKKESKKINKNITNEKGIK